MKNKFRQVLGILLLCLFGSFLISCSIFDTNSEPQTYKVEFYNEGIKLREDFFEEGINIVYKGQQPSKPASDYYSYEFKGWIDEDGYIYEKLPKASHDYIFSAHYKEVLKENPDATYQTITFKNGDVVLEEIQYQTNVKVNGLTNLPAKQPTIDETFNFVGWSDGENTYTNNDLPNATKDVVYQAVFESDVRLYDVVFTINNTIKTLKLAYGSKIDDVDNSFVEDLYDSYEELFVGWSSKENQTETEEIIVSGDLCVYAVFKQFYNVVFVDENNAELYSERVAEGDNPIYNALYPSKEDTKEYEYEFKGWRYKTAVYNPTDKLPKVTSDVVFIAIYRETRKTYQVNFIFEGIETKSTYYYGETAVFEGSTSIEPTNTTYYEFLGWSMESNGEIISDFTVTDNHVYYPVIKETVRKYEIKFVVDNEEEVIFAEYESLVTPSIITLKNRTLDKVYSFKGWKSLEDEEIYTEIPVVLGNMTFEAVYEETIRKYEVVFNYVDQDGNPFMVNGITVKTYIIEYGHSFNRLNSKIEAVSGYVTDTYWFDFDVTEHHIKNLIELEQITKTVKYCKADIWDGSVATEFASGTGTKDDPYQISTGAELAYLSSISNKVDYGSGMYFVLTNNIDLNGISWTPICYAGGGTTSWKYFGGNFDGNGKVIAGLSFNQTTKYGAGLFTGIKGSVKDLTIQGSINALHRAGALCYYLNGGSAENIVSYTDVTTTGNSSGCYTGGIFGSFTNAKVSNCINYGDVTAAYSNVGGVSGNSSGGSTVTDCYNYGEVTGASSTGGVLGIANKVVATNIYNYGNVNGGTEFVGGIVGNAYSAGNALSYLYNYGDVNATKSVGGIVGKNTQKLNHAYNYGNITGETNVGGVLGYADGGSNVLDVLENYGEVKGTSYVAGVIGYVKTTKTVTNLTNYGDITATDHVGGVVGTLQAAKLVGGVNNGDVVATGTTGDVIAGGVVGNAFDAACEVLSCVNYGNVTSKNHAGGVVGWLTQKLENCENYGTVKSSYRAGGIVGTSVGGDIYSSKNYGLISCLDTDSTTQKEYGGILGGNTTSGTVNNCINYGEIIGNYSVGFISGYVGKGSTVIECTNEGKITTTLKSTSYIGGLIGQDNN